MKKDCYTYYTTLIGIPHATTTPVNEKNMVAQYNNELFPKHDNQDFFWLTGAISDEDTLDSETKLN